MMERPYQLGEYVRPPFHPDVALHLFRIWVDDYGMRRNAIAANIGMTRAFVERIYHGEHRPTVNFAKGIHRIMTDMMKDFEICQKIQNDEYYPTDSRAEDILQDSGD
jgi:transcriptional regulator with XRE-family HTH domain